jgi:hypothetical protein
VNGFRAAIRKNLVAKDGRMIAVATESGNDARLLDFQS